MSYCLLLDLAEPSRSGLKDQQKFTVCHIRRERERKREHQIYGETESAAVHMPHQERGRGRERGRGGGLLPRGRPSREREDIFFPMRMEESVEIFVGDVAHWQPRE